MLFSFSDLNILSNKAIFIRMSSNEPVGKVLLTSESDVFGGHLTFPRHEIVDRGAFCETTFFCISPKNLLGHFFYSLNVQLQGPATNKRSAAG